MSSAASARTARPSRSAAPQSCAVTRGALERVEGAPHLQQRVHTRLVFPIALQRARQRRGDKRPRVTPKQRFEALLFPEILRFGELAVVFPPVTVVFVLVEANHRDMAGQPEGGRLLHGHAHGARDRLGVVIGRLDLREERLQFLDDAGHPRTNRARSFQGGEGAAGDIEHARTQQGIDDIEAGVAEHPAHGRAGHIAAPSAYVAVTTGQQAEPVGGGGARRDGRRRFVVRLRGRAGNVIRRFGRSVGRRA